jgi:hypothetical protein
VARKEVGGVRGVLGELITDAPREQPPAKNMPPSASAANPKPSATTKLLPPKKARARLGRPPGRQSSESSPKEKLTVRIDAGLAALYRDWSWDERCQLGELIERALRAYRKSR